VTILGTGKGYPPAKRPSHRSGEGSVVKEEVDVKGNMKLSTLLLLCYSVFLVFLLASCQVKPSALSDEKVIQVTEHILNAVTDGNYQEFLQDFSDQMKIAFPETEFTKLRNLLQNTSGNYRSCQKPTLLNNSSYVIYRLNCSFDLEGVIVSVTFKIGGDKVEGLFFDSTNLRKVGNQ
jgi:hypothetical protein